MSKRLKHERHLNRLQIIKNGIIKKKEEKLLKELDKIFNIPPSPIINCMICAKRGQMTESWNWKSHPHNYILQQEEINDHFYLIKLYTDDNIHPKVNLLEYMDRFTYNKTQGYIYIPSNNGRTILNICYPCYTSLIYMDSKTTLNTRRILRKFLIKK